MMNQRENFFAMYNGEKPEFVPCFGMFNKLCVMPGDVDSAGLLGAGMDAFGVNWVMNPAGAIPEPGRYLFEDMADWKECINWPDLDAIDYKEIAAIELADYNPEEQVLYIGPGCYSMFTRMESFMGFENALIALMEDPDSVHEFGEAFADFHIDRIRRIIDAYQPDVMWYSDDVAHAQGLFMSEETYRSLIKPYAKRIIDYMLSRGVIVNMHCCGKCDSIVDDFVEMGCRMFTSVQIMNDIEGIQKKYGHQLIIEGGWDSSGRPGFVDATVKEVCDEALRCINTYGKYGNFIIMPALMNPKGNAMFTGDYRLEPLFETISKNCML